ncbi:hypothetical protein MCUN1_002491 [Malassezia cuniculi]|uniref:Zn(2)-C6 fungal-type domain-containing protein n=1 Tax=Malassezia cuniculi TaxID=948313 RepID=A0AAF0EZT9_9BASI|nr:hypothetical protein MCUN1_002491 [Malassezia cuniculi]
MAQRLTLRKRNPYNTKSNRRRVIKTPSGKLRYLHINKLATAPKCGDCHTKLPGVKALRPREYATAAKRDKTVQRAYGGSRCANCVRTRVVRAFLVEESKIVKNVIKAQQAKHWIEERAIEGRARSMYYPPTDPAPSVVPGAGGANLPLGASLGEPSDVLLADSALGDVSQIPQFAPGAGVVHADLAERKRKHPDMSQERAHEVPEHRDPPKPKSTRGARACTNCHRLKMKCEGAENGGPCLRCARSGHECLFLESHRGRKSDKRRKSAAVQQNLKKMEQVLITVLQNMDDHSAQQRDSVDPDSPNSPGTSEPSRSFILSPMPNEAGGSPDDEDKRTQSMRRVAEAGANFVQQVQQLDEASIERLLEPNSALSSLLERHINSMQRGGIRPTAPQTSQGVPTQHVDESVKLGQLPEAPLNPLGLLAEASLNNMQRQRGGASDDGASGDTPGDAAQFGVANERYFQSSGIDAGISRAAPLESDRPPELLTEGIITSEEALELFRIFFHHCSLHLFLLDPEWHTPTFVCSRSQFLFTCVCAVASKFYSQRPELYAQCLHRAKKVAFDVLSRGIKSVEIVQGFLLLTLYNQPAERYEEDRTWLFAGVAIRMAQDLNMHRKCVIPENELNAESERELLNRERTWYICFCVDRTLCAQMGKPYSIRDDWLIRHSSEWCTQKCSRPWDLGICALVNLLRVQTRQLDFLYSSAVTPSGLNLDLDYPAILPSFNEQLNETMQYWYRLGLDTMMQEWNPALLDNNNMNAAGTQTGANGERPMDPPPPRRMPDMSNNKPPIPGASTPAGANAADKLRVSTLMALQQAGPPGDNADLITRSIYYIARQAPLRYNYAVLVLNSFGLQCALDRPSNGAAIDKPQYLVRCVHAAKEIIATVKHGMREILRYAPDPTFVAVAYACVFLLKLIRPLFANFINEDEVISLVTYTIEVLEEAAVDQTHTPALYASFLRNLLQSRHDHNVNGAMPPEPHSAGAAATVDPSQVNPLVAGLANSMAHEHTRLADLGNHSAEAPPLEPGAALGRDMSGLHPDPALNTGWDAQQYAKAHGVDVNRVLDNSFWTSFLPPGYGAGSVAQTPGPLDPRENDYFRMLPGDTQGMGYRTVLTPGATRASSPTGLLGSFPM